MQLRCCKLTKTFEFLLPQDPVQPREHPGKLSEIDCTSLPISPICPLRQILIRARTKPPKILHSHLLSGCGCRPLIIAPRRQRRVEFCAFKTNLVDTVNSKKPELQREDWPCLDKQTKNYTSQSKHSEICVEMLTKGSINGSVK